MILDSITLRFGDQRLYSGVGWQQGITGEAEVEGSDERCDPRHSQERLVWQWLLQHHLV